MDEEASLGDQQPDGSIEILAMRYNVSHQRGWRCFLAPLADDPTAITEDSAPSFRGWSLFDALAMFRATIEPAGGRLLQAMASRHCWRDTGSYDRFCRKLTTGSAQTELVDGLLPIEPGEAVTLEEQRASYEAWLASLPPPPDGGGMPKSPAMRVLEQSHATILAAREAATHARGDLARREGKDS